METRQILVVNASSDFDVLVQESTLGVTFMTASDYARFSEKNLNLTDLMEAAVNRIYGKTFADAHTCVGHDWWADHTRHISCDAQSFSQALFDALCALLVAEYDEWRILVAVYQEMRKRHTPLIGSMAVWSNKVLVDRELHKWMVDKGFDFGSSVRIRFVEADKMRLLRHELDAGVLLQPRETLLDDVD